MKDISNFFPKKVYFCGCLQEIIEQCEKGSSLQYFCNGINNNNSNDCIIYCAKCNDRKDVVFSCIAHMPMGTFTIQYVADNSTVMQIQDTHFCLLCIKKYLQKDYYKFNFFNNF